MSPVRTHRWIPVFCALLPAALTPSRSAAQQTMGPYRDETLVPDSPAGRHITEFIEVINAGDPERSRKFIEQSFTDEFRTSHTMDEHLDVFAMIHRQSGTLKYHSIRRYENPRPDDESVFILKNTLTGDWLGVTMTVAAAEPHRISGLGIGPARPPSDQAPADALTLDEVVAQLSTYVEKLSRADRFSGTVLLAKDGRVLFKKAYGLASKRFDAPNRIDTKFNLGSMNKMFTAVAVAQLVEQGKVSYDDPISKFLSSDWIAIEWAKKIKVRDLLGHTSGLGSYFSEAFMNASRARFRKIDDYKSVVAGDEPRFEPGSDWSYSNTGFLLAGAVVEKVTGGSYFDYIRQNVYGPAGMINSDCYAMDRPVPNLAIGYSPIMNPDGTTGWENNLFKHVIKGGPAGGGFSTVEDLLRFDQALRSGKLLAQTSLDRLWIPTEQSGGSYGYGFGIREVGGDRVVGHSGGFPGINAELDMYLNGGFTVAVMANYDQAASQVARKARALLTRLGEAG